jgi:flagellar hook-length control protein FliK
MKITDHAVSNRGGDSTPGGLKTRFSEVLRAASKKQDKQDCEGSVAPQLAAQLPFADLVSVDPEQETKAAPEALLPSLVQEITAEVSPGGEASVDIHFDSRTLEGLHVRVRKAGDSLEVKFFGASADVSRLLTAHTSELKAALVQRGYPMPEVLVERVPARSSSTRAAKRAERSGQGREQGQKRR